MTGAGAVVTLVLLEWTVGWLGAAAWTQTWSVVKRGHFRIVAWCVIGTALLTAFAGRQEEFDGVGALRAVTLALVCMSVVYLMVQYSNTDLPGAVVGGATAGIGLVALGMSGASLGDWPVVLAFAQLVSGALLLGAVTNGMLLGHWYLNQPGLKPWALSRLTTLTLVATGISGIFGLAAVARLSSATTEGAILGIRGFGESFGVPFYLIWMTLLGFTGLVVLAARRCIKLRSIQSATGLYYVAILTAGVSEFLVRYLMVNSA